jgi:endo-1,3(4)-beta-glucanase
MLPLNPSSSYTRTQTLVREEWDYWFQDISNVTGGWKGILMANKALVDPKESYDWFANPAFDTSFLDGGASRTWYMVFAAGLASVRGTPL